MKGLLTYYVGNTQVLELSGLKDTVSGNYQNDATVTVTLTDSAGASVSGQTWPAAMTYVPASNGTYRVTLDSDLVLTAGVTYTARIDVIAAGGIIGRWDCTVAVKPRRY